MLWLTKIINVLQSSLIRTLVVLVLLALAITKPSLPIEKSNYHYVFVLDISQSMNAQDYDLPGLPTDRLSFAKESIKYAIQNLPCHSKVALSIFTTKNMYLLFEPMEVCEHYTNIEKTLMNINWRMAWAADSHISRGLFTSIRDIERINTKPAIVFLTDGQQTPVKAKEPPFLDTPSVVKGWVVGVGNLEPVPVPKYDENDVVTSYWSNSEAESQQDSSSAAKVNSSKTYLTAVQENKLQQLAGLTGLSYIHLDSPEQFSRSLLSFEPEQNETVMTDIGWIFASLALIFLIEPYIKPVFLRLTKATL